MWQNKLLVDVRLGFGSQLAPLQNSDSSNRRLLLRALSCSRTLSIHSSLSRYGLARSALELCSGKYLGD